MLTCPGNPPIQLGSDSPTGEAAPRVVRASPAARAEIESTVLPPARRRWRRRWRGAAAWAGALVESERGGTGGGVVEWSRGGWLLNNRIGFRFSPPSLSVGSARLARPVATPDTGVYNGIF